MRRLKREAVQSVIDSTQMAACMGSFVITKQLVRIGKSLTKQKEIYLLTMHGDANLMNFTTYFLYISFYCTTSLITDYKVHLGHY